MNKEAKSPDEEWGGALSSIFEDDIHQPSEENWTVIAQEIFPNKNRGFNFFWMVSMVLLIGTIGYFYFETLSTSDDQVRHTLQQHKSSKAEVSSSKKDVTEYVKENLVEKLRNEIDKQNGLNINNEQTSYHLSDRNENSELINYSKNEVQEIMKFGLSQPQLDGDVLRNSGIRLTNLKTDEDQEFGYHNSMIQDRELDQPKLDTALKLKTLPIQLFLSSDQLDVLQIVENENTKFKPFFSVQLTPLMGRNIRIVSGIFNSDNTNSSALGDRRVSLPKYGFQVGVNYHLTGRFSLHTGFQMAAGDVQSRWFFRKLMVDPTSNDIRLKTTSGEARTSDPTLIQDITNGNAGVYKLRLNHAFVLFAIPIGVKYRFTDEMFSPYFKTGLNLEFFGKRTLSVDVLEKGIVRNIELDLNRPNIGLSLQAILALGIESNLKRKFNFFAEAGYCAPFNQFVNTNGFSVKMAGSNFLIGLRYDLK
jgi:hypothetical protein